VLAAGYADACPCAFEQRSVIVRASSSIIGTVQWTLPPPTSPEFFCLRRRYRHDLSAPMKEQPSPSDVARIANIASADLLCALGKNVCRDLIALRGAAVSRE